MSDINELLITKLVELARNPTPTDMANMDRLLNSARAERDRLSYEKDKLFAAGVAADPHLTELYKAAEELLKAHGTSIRNSPHTARLRAAIKAAAPHVDLIPF